MRATSYLEWIAFLFGVAQVVLALKNKTLNFYAGIVSVSLYIIVFYQFGLYAESLLNIYYLLISIAGIFLWRQKNNSVLAITSTGRMEWIKALFIFSAALLLLFIILRSFTNSNVPFMDAFVTASAWTGTWLMIKRKLENWLVLNLSNVVAIPLQFYKGMELTALLTLIYLIVAILGYIEWKKTMDKPTQLLSKNDSA